MHRGKQAPGAFALVLVAASTFAGVARAADPPLDPPRAYVVTGAARASLTGPHCCGASRLVGRFHGSYAIDAMGQVQVADLRLEFDDNVVVFEGLGGFSDGRVPLRCGALQLSQPAPGAFDGGSTLTFAPGSLSFNALAFADRLGDGTCDNPSVAFGASNATPASVQHDPWGNVFALSASFHASIASESYDLTLQLDGRFVNRPPQARLGLATEDFQEPHCLAYWHWNGEQQWELVAEANDPAGLKATLVSLGGDLDGGWESQDVVSLDWFNTRGSGARTSLGAGTPVGPVVFEWGPTHRVELLASDHHGASSADACTFRVIDSTPPTVQAPAALTLECTEVGGASPASAPALRAFLAGASASDRADSAPVALPAQMSGTDITDATLFPADGWSHAVSFRFADQAGNVGSASADVQVVDTKAPAVTASASPSLLYADYKFWVVGVSLGAHDVCGSPITWRLVSIKSNAPAYDASDILDATYGSDDRAFVVFTRPAAPGVARVYTAYYEGRDAAGNAALAKATIKVKE